MDDRTVADLLASLILALILLRRWINFTLEKSFTNFLRIPGTFPTTCFQMNLCVLCNFDLVLAEELVELYTRSWSSPPPLVKLPGAFLWTSWHPGVGSIVDSSDPHIHGLMRNSFLVHPETILSIRLVEKTQLYLILGKPPNSPKIWNIENFHILTLWKISTPFILTFKNLIYLVCSMSHDILGSDNLHIIVNVPDALCWTD